MSYFDSAFTLVVGVEAGYVNDPKDPGGETKYGISKRAYPKEDIPNMSLERAKFLYKRDYWDAHGLDSLNWEQALLVFDCAINGGNHQRWYQLYSESPQFGVMFQAERALYLASLPGWMNYGRGWSRRLFTMFKASQTTPEV